MNLHHHACWGGPGYPHAWAGDGIPLDGRILAVAHTYDALVREWAVAFCRRTLSLAPIRNNQAVRVDRYSLTDASLVIKVF